MYIFLVAMRDVSLFIFVVVENSHPELRKYSELFAIAQMDFSVANILKFFQRPHPCHIGFILVKNTISHQPEIRRELLNRKILLY